jgi:hypothetical protein
MLRTQYSTFSTPSNLFVRDMDPTGRILALVFVVTTKKKHLSSPRYFLPDTNRYKHSLSKASRGFKEASGSLCAGTMDRACRTADEEAFLLYRQALIFMAMDVPQQTPAAEPEQQSQQAPAAEPEQQSHQSPAAEPEQQIQQAPAAQLDQHTLLLLPQEYLDEENNISLCSSPTDFDDWLYKQDLDIQYAWPGMQENL